MITRNRFLNGFLLLFVALPSFAFVQIVHKGITRLAGNSASLQLVERLGPAAADRIMGQPAVEWMAQGAYDEDRYTRSLHHFYDPVHDSGLEVPLLFCADIWTHARKWAIDDLANDYNLEKAKEYYWNSLFDSSQSARNDALKELFLSLGHQVHLVQDMAQPEHTRNDQHLPLSGLGNGVTASIWEEWGEKNLTEKAIPAHVPQTPVVSFGGYPSVVMPAYEDYFHTSNRAGMADFSNGNFMTQDTNYQDEIASGACRRFLTSPAVSSDGTPGNAAARHETVREQFYNPALMGYDTIAVDEDIFTYVVVDHYAGGLMTDEFHTYRSALDLETRQLGKTVYSLSDSSYKSRAALLLPRAVGYSRGYLEKFFRGSSHPRWWHDADSNTYELTLRNTTGEVLGSDAVIPAAFIVPQGYFGAGGDDLGHALDKTPLSSLVPGFVGLQPGESVTISDIKPPDLKPGDCLMAYEQHFMVNGTLGVEKNAILADVVGPASHHTLARCGDNAPVTITGAISSASFHKVDIGCGLWTLFGGPGGCDGSSHLDVSTDELSFSFHQKYGDTEHGVSIEYYVPDPEARLQLTIVYGKESGTSASFIEKNSRGGLWNLSDVITKFCCF